MIARRDPKVLSPMVACIMISSASLMLSACGKTVEFKEEVQLFGSDKKVILERREVFEFCQNFYNT